jgi:hypothetical protein
MNVPMTGSGMKVFSTTVLRELVPARRALLEAVKDVTGNASTYYGKQFFRGNADVVRQLGIWAQNNKTFFPAYVKASVSVGAARSEVIRSLAGETANLAKVLNKAAPKAYSTGTLRELVKVRQELAASIKAVGGSWSPAEAKLVFRGDAKAYQHIWTLAKNNPAVQATFVDANRAITLAQTQAVQGLVAEKAALIKQIHASGRVLKAL